MPDAPKVTRKTARNRDFRIVFANAIRLRLGDNECGITFVMETDDETGNIVLEDQIQVVMTPRSLKILQLTLNHAMTELERAIGPITLAPEKMAELEKALASAQAKPTSS